MPTRPEFMSLRAVIARFLKVRLRSYPEHVIVQALREADKVFCADASSAYRAILAAEQLAQARMVETRQTGSAAADTVSRQQTRSKGKQKPYHKREV